MDTKPRLLLVDNDREFAREMKIALEKQGFELLHCHTAREAWETVEFEEPGLVISEVMLENHDSGFQLAKQIKGDPRFKMIPVILLTDLKRKTGYEFDFERDGYWMKADDYLEKPISVSELTSLINRRLGRESESR